MRKSNLVRLMLVLSLIGLLAWTVGGVTQVAALKGSDIGIGRYIIEDIQMCGDGATAYMVGIANSDDAQLYKYDLTQDKVVGICDVGVLYGPRGGRGLALNADCTSAYVINYPSNTVSVIDLAGTEWAEPGAEEIPACTSAAEIPVDPKPTAVLIAGSYLVVTNSLSDEVTVIDTSTNEVVCTAAEVGFGPNSLVFLNQPYLKTLGEPLVLVVNAYDDTIASINPIPKDSDCVVFKEEVTGLDRTPWGIVATPDLRKAYTVNYAADAVDVIDLVGLDAGKAKIYKSIPVGDTPRYIAISSDGRFVFAVNTIDKTISVISTATDEVIETIEVLPATEPAPIGVIALTPDNNYLYVFWTGGRSGTPADFILYKFDLSPLYRP